MLVSGISSLTGLAFNLWRLYRAFQSRQAIDPLLLVATAIMSVGTVVFPYRAYTFHRFLKSRED